MKTYGNHIIRLLYFIIVIPFSAGLTLYYAMYYTDQDYLKLFWFMVVMHLLYWLIGKSVSKYLFTKEMNLEEIDDVNKEQLLAYREEIKRLKQAIVMEEEEIQKIQEQIKNGNLETLRLISEIEQEEIRHEQTLSDLYAFFEMSHQLVMMVDDRGTIIYSNPSFLQLLKKNLDQVVSKNLKNVLLSNDEHYQVQPIYNFLHENVNRTRFFNYRLKDASISKDVISISITKAFDDQYLLIGKAVHDELLLKTFILTKNREIEYINQASSSLISNSSLELLFDSITEEVQRLFKFKEILLFQGTKDKRELLSCTNFNSQVPDDVLNEILKHKDLSLISVSHLIKWSKYAMIISLSTIKENSIYMVIFTDKVISKNDLSIMTMFSNLASIVIQRAVISENLKQRFMGTIAGLIDFVEAKDKYTEGHSKRVHLIAKELGKELELGVDDLEVLSLGALLHDIGKIGIAQKILSKSGKLTNEEYNIIKTHPEKGQQILAPIGLDQRIIDAVYYHHKRYDLKGYPEDVSLKSLPFFAAIVGVADSFDAMTSKRSYTEPKTIDEAIAELVRYSGTQFHPSVVEAMQQIIEFRREDIEQIIGDKNELQLSL